MPATSARPETRRNTRVRECGDLHAALRPPKGRPASVEVADLCVDGMGVRSVTGLQDGDVVRFELWGRSFAWSGRARVAHAAGDRAGLAFVAWDGPAHRPLGRLLHARRLAS
jgi:hypothetical protein